MKNLIGFLFVSLFVLTSFTVGSSLQASESNSFFSSEKIAELNVDTEVKKIDWQNLSEEDLLNLSEEDLLTLTKEDLLTLTKENLVMVGERGCMNACWNAYMMCQAGGGSSAGCFTSWAECTSACNNPQN